MRTPLNLHQRNFAQFRTTFGTELFSKQLAGALFEAAMTSGYNQKSETGIIELLCMMYLDAPNEVARHISGDFGKVVRQIFPALPRRQASGGAISFYNQQMPEGGSTASEFGCLVNYSDELLRLLWLSARLAGAIGKKASYMDVIAGVSLENCWMEELARVGLSLRESVADFDAEVRSVVFCASPHSREDRSTSEEFEFEASLQPPYSLQVTTPSGPFLPVHSAKIALNGQELTSVSWPGNPTSKIEVRLQAKNKIRVELNGPRFGSVQLTIRGNVEITNM